MPGYTLKFPEIFTRFHPGWTPHNYKAGPACHLRTEFICESKLGFEASGLVRPLPSSTANARRSFTSTSLTIFLIVMINLILIGSGLFSKSIGNLQQYEYKKLSVYPLVRTPHSVPRTLATMSSRFLGWVLTLTTPVVMNRARTTSVGTLGTLTAVPP